MKPVYAKQAAVVMMPEGYPVTVPYGTHWSSEDVVVRLRPDLFSDDPRFGLFGNPPDAMDEPPVETATAAPGEKRKYTRRV
jgi:hypothetical protein